MVEHLEEVPNTNMGSLASPGPEGQGGEHQLRSGGEGPDRRRSM